MIMKHIVALSFGVLLLHKGSLAMDNDTEDLWQPILNQFSPNMNNWSPNVVNRSLNNMNDNSPIIEDKAPATIWDFSPVLYRTQPELQIVPHHNNDDNNNNSNNDSKNTASPDTVFLLCNETSLEKDDATHNNTSVLPQSIMCGLCKTFINDALAQHMQLYHPLIAIAQSQQPATPQSQQNPPVPKKKWHFVSPHYSPNKLYACMICKHKYTTFYYLPKHEGYCRKKHPNLWALADQQGITNPSSYHLRKSEAMQRRTALLLEWVQKSTK